MRLFSIIDIVQLLIMEMYVIKYSKLLFFSLSHHHHIHMHIHNIVNVCLIRYSN